MQYELYDTITQNAVYSSNPDGTLTAVNVAVQVNIVGAPADKFIQTDVLTPLTIPADTEAQNIPAYIEAQALLYVQTTYPNT